MIILRSFRPSGTFEKAPNHPPHKFLRWWVRKGQEHRIWPELHTLWDFRVFRDLSSLSLMDFRTGQFDLRRQKLTETWTEPWEEKPLHNGHFCRQSCSHLIVPRCWWWNDSMASKTKEAAVRTGLTEMRGHHENQLPPGKHGMKHNETSCRFVICFKMEVHQLTLHQISKEKPCETSCCTTDFSRSQRGSQPFMRGSWCVTTKHATDWNWSPQRFNQRSLTANLKGVGAIPTCRISTRAIPAIGVTKQHRFYAVHPSGWSTLQQRPGLKPSAQQSSSSSYQRCLLRYLVAQPKSWFKKSSKIKW